VVAPMLSMDQLYPNVAYLYRGKTRKSTSFENMNRRTAEQGTAEYRSEKHCLTPLKTSVVRNSLFDIVLRTPHTAGGSPVSKLQICFGHLILEFVICDLGFLFLSLHPANTCVDYPTALSANSQTEYLLTARNSR
jgi:hypothetical protein